MNQVTVYNVPFLCWSLYTEKWKLMGNLQYSAIPTHKILFRRVYNRQASVRLTALAEFMKPKLEQMPTTKSDRSLLSP